MNHLKYLSRSGLAGLVLITGGALGLVVACSSDGGNAAPGTPVINTGGGGKANGAAGEAPGEAGTPEQGGNTGTNGGATGEAGEAGQGGEAGTPSTGGTGGGTAGSGGSGGTPVSCPTTDVGFYNQTSTSQKSAFDNVKRLGTHATLPALP